MSQQSQYSNRTDLNAAVWSSWLIQWVFWCAVLAISFQSATLVYRSGAAPTELVLASLVPVLLASGLNWFLRREPGRPEFFADITLLLAVAGFGGLAMLVGSEWDAGADSSNPPAEHIATSPDGAHSSHHLSPFHKDEQAALDHGSARHQHKLLGWSTGFMLLACGCCCWWICKLRPRCARPRDWRHHCVGMATMFVGMVLAAHWLGPPMERWLQLGELTNHIVMVIGMVGGTAAGISSVDRFDLVTRNANASGAVPLKPARQSSIARKEYG